MVGDYHKSLGKPLQACNSDSSVGSTLVAQEEALHALCKQILKTKVFRGFYIERRRADAVNGFRDVVALHRSELDLEKLLWDIQKRVTAYYRANGRNVWFGLSVGAIDQMRLPKNALKTVLWLEFNNLAFGEYWFQIKSLRTRDNEIYLKLKILRPVQKEDYLSSSRIHTTTLEQKLEDPKQQPDLQDFVNVTNEWLTSTKRTIYEFMARDVSKENIMSTIRFLGLLVVSLISFLLVGIKYLGIFTLRFMFEFTRMAHVLTPIVIKFMDICSKIVGGFYLLLAMMWRDAVGGKRQSSQQRLAITDQQQQQRESSFTNIRSLDYYPSRHNLRLGSPPGPAVYKIPSEAYLD